MCRQSSKDKKWETDTGSLAHGKVESDSVLPGLCATVRDLTAKMFGNCFFVMMLHWCWVAPAHHAKGNTGASSRS